MTEDKIEGLRGIKMPSDHRPDYEYGKGEELPRSAMRSQLQSFLPQ